MLQAALDVPEATVMARPGHEALERVCPGASPFGTGMCDQKDVEAARREDLRRQVSRLIARGECEEARRTAGQDPLIARPEGLASCAPKR